MHLHLEITKKKSVNLDAIKASVPKFLNFLGADQLMKADQFRRNNPSPGWDSKINFKFQKTLFVPKIKTLDRIGVMQKFLFFCPEENTKPFDRNYATINT